VLKYFSTVLPNSTYKAGIEWCAALCDSCVRVFFNSQFPPIKQELSDVLLFCDYLCCYFSTVLPNFHLWSRIEWCAALLWLHVLEYFQQSTQFPPIRLSDVLLFFDYTC
jgi:hypothetical protein